MTPATHSRKGLAVLGTGLGPQAAGDNAKKLTSFLVAIRRIVSTVRLYLVHDKITVVLYPVIAFSCDIQD